MLRIHKVFFFHIEKEKMRKISSAINDVWLIARKIHCMNKENCEKNKQPHYVKIVFICIISNRCDRHHTGNTQMTQWLLCVCELDIMPFDFRSMLNDNFENGIVMIVIIWPCSNARQSITMEYTPNRHAADWNQTFFCICIKNIVNLKYTHRCVSFFSLLFILFCPMYSISRLTFVDETHAMNAYSNI